MELTVTLEPVGRTGLTRGARDVKRGTNRLHENLTAVRNKVGCRMSVVPFGQARYEGRSLMMSTDTIELELQSLKRPQEVLDFRVASGQDATGDEALWVWLVVQPGTTADPIALDRLEQFKQCVRERVLSLRPGVWPYLRLENPADSVIETGVQ